jgi:hypothetical protein
MGLAEEIVLTFKNAQGTQSGLWDGQPTPPSTGEELMTRFLALEMVFDAQQAALLAVLKRLGDEIEKAQQL